MIQLRACADYYCMVRKTRDSAYSYILDYLYERDYCNPSEV